MTLVSCISFKTVALAENSIGRRAVENIKVKCTVTCESVSFFVTTSHHMPTVWQAKCSKFQYRHIHLI